MQILEHAKHFFNFPSTGPVLDLTFEAFPFGFFFNTPLEATVASAEDNVLAVEMYEN